MSTLHRFPAIAAAALVLGLSLPATAQEAAPAPTPAEMEAFLLNAELTDVRDAGAGVIGSQRATASDGRLTHDVHIQTVDVSRSRFVARGARVELNFRDSYRYNIAAYRLAALLGIDSVPMSVLREVDGEPAAVALVLVLHAGAGTQAPAEAQAHPGRVVAVGDVHGAGDELKTILRRTGLIDLDDRWSGGTATLVQTGDVTDRGPRVREIMDFLMRLEDDARDAGGEVRVLLGNHEAMNLLGDLRDVTPAIFASFASDDAERRREDAYRQYVEHASRRRAGDGGSGHPAPMSRSAWMASHPPGFVEYMEAMGPDGRYGRWLRGKPIATVVGDTLFVHGGLSPDMQDESVDALNDTARGEIETFDRHRRHLVDAGLILPFSTLQEMFAVVTAELRAWIERLSPDRPGTRWRRRSVTRRERALLDVLTGLQTINDWSIVNRDGPLWFRGLALRPEPEVAGFIGDVLGRFGVARAVVGHSVTASRRITSRAGGRVFLIDTGMLHGAYRGRPSALELLDGRVTAIYPDERVLLYPEEPVLLDAPAPR